MFSIPQLPLFRKKGRKKEKVQKREWRVWKRKWREDYPPNISGGICTYPFSRFRVLLSSAVLEFVELIDREIPTEFAIILKGEMHLLKGQAVIREAWVPEQEVSVAFVRVIENYSVAHPLDEVLEYIRSVGGSIKVIPAPTRLRGNLGILHKHPEGIYIFSSIDHTHLTRNNNVSLLWTRSRGICDWVVSIPTFTGRCYLPKSIVSVKVVEPEEIGGGRDWIERVEWRKKIRMSQGFHFYRG